MAERPEEAGETSRASRFRPLVSIAVVLLTVVALYYVVRALPLELLGEIRPKRIVWWTIPLIGLLQILFLFLAADIWRRVVRALTGTNITFWSAYVQLAVVAVGKYVPGKVWGFVARAGEMYRQQIPVHLSVMSSVVEQLLVMTGALLVAVAAALFALPQYRLPIIVAGVALFVLAIMTLVKVPSLTMWLLRRRGVRDVPAEMPRYHATSVLGFSIGYAGLWILSGLIFSIIYFSLFDAPVRTESAAALTLANTTGIVLGFFAFFVPGGLGVREAVATGVLAGFVPVREALLAAVSYRAWMILIDGVNGVFLMVREAKLAKQKHTDHSDKLSK
jgi:uncharacterized membrane protein YbhN (UPF0104 family)